MMDKLWRYCGDNAVALQTIVIKEVQRFLRIWVQTLLPPAISMTLYFIIFGNLIGPRIGVIQGLNYIDYIAPGLIMMSVINNSYANVVGSFFGAKFQRHIEEMLIAPIPMLVLFVGYVIGGMVRGILVGSVVTIVALYFTSFHLYSAWITFSVAILTSILFAICGIINGIFAQKFDDISVIPTFVLLPLIYLGGVFYSIDLLPPFWQQISAINPILYMVNAFRYGMLGVSDINIYYAFFIIFIFIIITSSVALYLLKKGIGIKT